MRLICFGPVALFRPLKAGCGRREADAYPPTLVYRGDVRQLRRDHRPIATRRQAAARGIGSFQTIQNPAVASAYTLRLFDVG